jgi:hypothetical protein
VLDRRERWHSIFLKLLAAVNKKKNAPSVGAQGGKECRPIHFLLATSGKKKMRIHTPENETARYEIMGK